VFRDQGILDVRSDELIRSRLHEFSESTQPVAVHRHAQIRILSRHVMTTFTHAQTLEANVH
jgi:hypothetical protein